MNGGLYFPWDQDDLVARKVLEIEGRDRYRVPIINEGGAIHVDGQGTDFGPASRAALNAALLNNK